jgi:hypothetical protein
LYGPLNVFDYVFDCRLLDTPWGRSSVVHMMPWLLNGGVASPEREALPRGRARLEWRRLEVVVATLPMSACGFKIYLYDEALVRWRVKVLFDSTVLMVLTSQLARLLTR